MSQQLLTKDGANRTESQSRVRSVVRNPYQVKCKPAKGKHAMAASASLRTVDPDKLVDHPFSVAIYGQDLDDAFVESIRRCGIEQPIVVAADGKTVVAGHRRRRAAKKAGLKRVPIVVRADLTDELDIKHAIIETNRQRVKTPEQIGREAQALWRIEQENAARRRNAHLKQAQESVRPKSDKRAADDTEPVVEGRSDDIVAQQLGVGRDTIRKAVFIARAIDDAEATGNQDRVLAIRRYSTVNAAYREALKSATSGDADQTIEDESLSGDLTGQEWKDELSAKSEEFRSVFLQMSKVAHELEVIANAHFESDKYYKSCSIAWDKLCHAIIAWEEAQLSAG